MGLVWQIASATGWSVKYILWGISYQELCMMLSDAPRYEKVRGKKKYNANPKSLASFLMNKNKNESG